MGFKVHRKALLISLAGLLSLALLLCGCKGADGGQADWEEALEKTAQSQVERVERPEYAAIGGEWTVISLARSGVAVPDSYWEIYLTNLKKALKETDGVLSEEKYTEYSRVDLALTALGEYPRDFDGYDLLQPLADFDTVTKYGVNGAAYALMALDSGAYEFADADTDASDIRAAYVDWIVAQERDGGGYSYAETADSAEADMTAIVLQSLVPYQDDEQVKDVVERGIAVLSSLQDEEGYYTSFQERSSETLSQTIIALSALGIDCNTDERFVKNGKGMMDALMTFYDGDGGFSHDPEGETQVMSTEQALCALTAYDRFLAGESALMDMTDIQ